MKKMPFHQFGWRAEDEPMRGREIDRFTREAMLGRQHWGNEAAAEYQTTLVDFLCRHGREYEPQPKPKKYRWRSEKACYRNATMLAIVDSSLTYVEGMAPLRLSSPERAFWLPYAWCIDTEGRVIDVTRREGAERYVGVPFQTKWLARMLLSNNIFDSMLVNLTVFGDG